MGRGTSDVYLLSLKGGRLATRFYALLWHHLSMVLGNLGGESSLRAGGPTLPKGGGSCLHCSLALWVATSTGYATS